INKGEVVWTLNIQDVALLGRFITTGVVDFTKTIAVAGPEVIEPTYVKAVYGTPISVITDCNVSKGINVRFINGNVLSGTQIFENGVLSPFANVISVIAEGDTADEFAGWAMPRLNKFSNSNLFATKIIRKIFPKAQFDFDARILGGERAFIMSGEMEQVFPMDILPEQLLKAMIAKNIDKMEQLGAFEVAPEDFALCEFVCTSKIELQKIVREALDYMKKELE
ncbi:MAG: NADH:ubiquinone reductase (Na(+)-transporting) subunit A, partial [Paludibacter sp.]|nr:NADH:ubiquinone reductase (Na(+)-transporting) subunit A [Paludibacter sp.]